MLHEAYLQLVDDDDAVHYLYGRLFKKLGLKISTQSAKNGEEACDQIKRLGPPELLLLDLRMPCMDGHEVMHWLENEKSIEAPTVFVLTSSIRVEDKAQVEKYSFVESYAEKPLRYEMFLTLLSPHKHLQALFANIH